MEKSEFLNGLQEEYHQWEALLSQFDPAYMDESGVTGHWSIKDIVAHLTGGVEQLPAYKLHHEVSQNRLHLGQHTYILTMKSMRGFMRLIMDARCLKCWKNRIKSFKISSLPLKAYPNTF